VTKTVGGWRHLRLGTVNLPISFWLAVGSVPAAIAGVWTISLLHDAYGDSLDDIVLTMLAIALVAVGLLVLIRALFIPGLAASERESFELTRGHKLSAVAIGAAHRIRDWDHLRRQRNPDRRIPDRVLQAGSTSGGWEPTSSTPRSCSGRQESRTW
jgi:hypothetical protein